MSGDWCIKRGCDTDKCEYFSKELGHICQECIEELSDLRYTDIADIKSWLKEAKTEKIIFNEDGTIDVFKPFDD